MSWPANARRILLSSAARTATATCPQIRNASHQYARFYLDVSGASGTGGLVLVLRGFSWNGVTNTNGEAMGNPAVLMTAPVAVTGSGVYVYEITQYPQTARGDVKLSVADTLPMFWDVQVQHQDGSTYTYSVSADLTA
jgi:hypothetical protein